MKWKYVEHSWSDTGIYDELGRHIAALSIRYDCDEDTQDACEKRMGEEARLIAAAPEMLAMLEELEWAFHDNLEMECCPVCSQYLEVGEHRHDCTLGNLLQRIRGEQ